MGLQTRPIGGQTPDEVDVALSRLIQLGIFAQSLVVDGEGHKLGLLELEPVDCHLQIQRETILSCIPDTGQVPPPPQAVLGGAFCKLTAFRVRSH